MEDTKEKKEEKREKYVPLEMEVVKFSCRDIIITSGNMLDPEEKDDDM